MGVFLKTVSKQSKNQPALHCIKIQSKWNQVNVATIQKEFFFLLNKIIFKKKHLVNGYINIPQNDILP